MIPVATKGYLKYNIMITEGSKPATLFITSLSCVTTNKDTPTVVPELFFQQDNIEKDD